MYYLITIVLLLLFSGSVLQHWQHKRRQDSPLKRRGILNITEQIILLRLQQILPQHTILAHVAFDALLTTKYAHTRKKYQMLMADFVVLDQQYQVLAIVEIVDESYLNRRSQKHYQDNLLELAGYRVLRYSSMPTEQQLRADLIPEHTKFLPSMPSATARLSMERSVKYGALAAKST